MQTAGILLIYFPFKLLKTPLSLELSIISYSTQSNLSGIVDPT
jgi:hypothetical protein